MENMTNSTKASTLGAFSYASTQACAIVPTFGVLGDVRPFTDAGASRAWSPPV